MGGVAVGQTASVAEPTRPSLRHPARRVRDDASVTNVTHACPLQYRGESEPNRRGHDRRVSGRPGLPKAHVKWYKYSQPAVNILVDGLEVIQSIANSQVIFYMSDLRRCSEGLCKEDAPFVLPPLPRCARGVPQAGSTQAGTQMPLSHKDVDWISFKVDEIIMWSQLKSPGASTTNCLM